MQGVVFNLQHHSRGSSSGKHPRQQHGSLCLYCGLSTHDPSDLSLQRLLSLSLPLCLPACPPARLPVAAAATADSDRSVL